MKHILLFIFAFLFITSFDSYGQQTISFHNQYAIDLYKSDPTRYIIDQEDIIIIDEHPIYLKQDTDDGGWIYSDIIDENSLITDISCFYQLTVNTFKILNTSKLEDFGILEEVHSLNWEIANNVMLTSMNGYEIDGRISIENNPNLSSIENLKAKSSIQISSNPNLKFIYDISVQGYDPNFSPEVLNYESVSIKIDQNNSLLRVSKLSAKYTYEYSGRGIISFFKNDSPYQIEETISDSFSSYDDGVVSISNIETLGILNGAISIVGDSSLTDIKDIEGSDRWDISSNPELYNIQNIKPKFETKLNITNNSKLSNVSRSIGADMALISINYKDNLAKSLPKFENIETNYFTISNSMMLEDISGINGIIANEINILENGGNIDLSTLNNLSASELKISKNFGIQNLKVTEGLGISSLIISQNSGLEEIIISAPDIGGINISHNQHLSKINIEKSSEKSNLGIVSNDNLKTIICNNKMVGSLSVNSNMSLNAIDFKDNLFNFLSISEQDDLQNLNLQRSTINNLIVKKVKCTSNLNLFDCNLDKVQLEDIKSSLVTISDNIDNMLSQLDISSSLDEMKVHLEEFQITRLNIEAGINGNLSITSEHGSPNTDEYNINLLYAISSGKLEIDFNSDIRSMYALGNGSLNIQKIRFVDSFFYNKNENPHDKELISNSTFGYFSVDNLANIKSLKFLESSSIANLTIRDNNFIESIGILNGNNIGKLNCTNLESLSLIDILADSIDQLNLTNLPRINSLLDLPRINNLSLTLNNLPQLKSLVGLPSNIESVSLTNIPIKNLEGIDKVYYNLLVLADLAFLESLNGINSSYIKTLVIRNCPKLSSLDAGLDKLSASTINITNNESIITLDGIQHFQHDSLEMGFSIRSNANLTDATALNSIVNRRSLSVRDNFKLKSCCFASEWEYFNVINNAPGCRNQEEIHLFCDLEVTVFNSNQEEPLTKIDRSENSESEVSFNISNNSLSSTFFEFPKIPEVPLILKSDDVELKLIEETNESYVYELKNSVIDFDKLFASEVPNLKFEIVAEVSEEEIVAHSFQAGLIKSAILFIDMNESDGRNFTELIRKSIITDGEDISRIYALSIKHEIDYRSQIDNIESYVPVLEEILNKYLLRTSSDGVDVVAFGQAAIYARKHLSNSKFPVNRFISINAPHSGSEIARSRKSIDDFILAYIDLISTFTGFGKIVGSIGSQVTQEVLINTMQLNLDLILENPMASFDPNSPLIAEVNSNYGLSGIPKHVFLSEYDFEENSILTDKYVPLELRSEYLMYDVFTAPCPQVKKSLIAGDGNDCYSSLSSQSGGLNNQYQTTFSGDYGNLDRVEIRHELFQLLDDPNRIINFTSDPFSYIEPSDSELDQCADILDLTIIIKNIGKTVAKTLINSNLTTAYDANRLTASNNQDFLIIDTTYLDQVVVKTNLKKYYLLTSYYEFAEIKSTGIDTLNFYFDKTSASPFLISTVGFDEDSIPLYDSRIILPNIDSLQFNLTDIYLNGKSHEPLNFTVLAENSDNDTYELTARIKYIDIDSSKFELILPGILQTNQALHDTIKISVGQDTSNLILKISNKEQYLALNKYFANVPENFQLTIPFDSADIISNYTDFDLDSIQVFSSNESVVVLNKGGKIYFYFTNNVDYESTKSIDTKISLILGSINFQRDYSVNVIDQNESPISNDTLITINENLINGSVVMNIKAIDPEEDNLEYLILSGNESQVFSITNDSGEIRVANQDLLNFELKPEFQLSVEINDGNLSIVRQIKIELNDLNEPPYDIVLSSNTISENIDIGSLIGNFTTLDEDGTGSFAYRLENKEDVFYIDMDRLISNKMFDFEEEPSHIVEVTTTDQGGLSFSKTFEITIIDVDDNSLAFNESVERASIFPNPAKDYVFIQWDNFQRSIIADLSGRSLIESTNPILDIRTLSNGVYFITLCGLNMEQITFKLIKE